MARGMAQSQRRKTRSPSGAPNDSSWFVVVPFAQIAVRGRRVDLDRRAWCVQQRAAAVPVGRPTDGPGPMPGLGRSRFLRAAGACSLRRRGLRHRDVIDRQRQLHARIRLPQGSITLAPLSPRRRRLCHAPADSAKGAAGQAGGASPSSERSIAIVCARCRAARPRVRRSPSA